MSYADAARPRRRKVNPAPFIIALVLEFFWSVFMVAGLGEHLAKDPPQALLGRLLLWAVVGGAIAASAVYVVSYLKAGPNRALPVVATVLVFPILLQCSVATLASANVKSDRAQKVQEAIATQELKAQESIATEEIKAAIESLANTEPGSPRIDVSTRATGPVGARVQMIKTHLAKLQEDQIEFRIGIRDSGVLDSLKPWHLAKDPSLKVTRANIAKARLALQKFSDLHAQHNQDFIRAMQGNSLGAFDRNSQLSASLLNSRMNSSDEFVNLEGQVLDEVEAAVVELQRSRGLWEARGGQLVFTYAPAMFAYRKHLDAMQRYSAQQNALHDEAVRNALDHAGQMVHPRI